jgi:ADP-heptose:LPS heptosyltransferase
VVRQHNQLGDMICSLPLYAALKKKFPACKITLAAADTNYPIPFNDINPFLDRIIIFKKSSVNEILKFLKQLRQDEYSFGIVPSTVKISRTSHLINFLSGAKIRVGVKSIDNEKNSSGFLLNVKAHFDWNRNKVHQNFRNLDVVKQIGCNLNEDEIKKLNFNMNDEDNNFADNFVNKNFSDQKKLIIGIHPGAGKIKNVWNTEKFISLISQLNKKYNPYFIITAGWTDNKVIFELNLKLSSSGIKIFLVENYPVKKLAAILERTNLYITNDTGSMHIAGLTKVKQISLFGPTNSFEWAPQRENKFSIQSESGNINDITVDEVFNLCETLI